MSEKQLQNGAFRKKKANYSMVSNIALKDKKLSLSAKGLYSMIQCYITLEDFVIYKNYLISICQDGKTKFDRAWDELKSNGYLIQYQMQDSEGKIYYEYDLLDEPAELSEEEKKAFEQKEANRIARNKRKTEKQKQKKQPQVEVPPTEKTIDGSSMNGSSTNGSSTSISNTDLSNTDLSNTDSSSSIGDEDNIATEIINLYKECISKNISNKIKSDLKKLVAVHGEDIVITAINITASKATSPNFEYVRNCCINSANTKLSIKKPFTSQNSARSSKFNNTYEHEWDFEKLAQLEQDYIDRQITKKEED